MGIADVAIIAAVAAGVVLAIRHLRSDKGSACASCGSSSTCAAHASGSGECPVSAHVVGDMEERLADAPDPAVKPR